MSITEMSNSTTNSNSILFEMRVLNDLRKLTAEQRKELLKTIENDEQLEEEALKKNPNLHLERKLQLVLNEIKELKQEIQTIQKNKDNTSCNTNCNASTGDYLTSTLSAGCIKEQPYLKCFNSKCCLDVNLIDSDSESTSSSSTMSTILSNLCDERLWWYIFIIIILGMTLKDIQENKKSKIKCL